MAVAEDAIKTLKTATERQKATRAATQEVAADIAARQASGETQATSTEVKR